jgi:hypothetical protein
VDIWDDFVKLVRIHFEYLETKYNYKFLSSTQPSVKYQSNFLMTGIFLAQVGTPEIDLYISEIPDQNNSSKIWLDNLIFVYCGSETERIHKFPRYDVESLDIAVKEMAILLEKYGTNILRGGMKELERFLVLRKIRYRDIGWQ